eukprot:gene10650-biopygen7782
MPGKHVRLLLLSTAGWQHVVVSAPHHSASHDVVLFFTLAQNNHGAHPLPPRTPQHRQGTPPEHLSRIPRDLVSASRMRMIEESVHEGTRCEAGLLPAPIRSICTPGARPRWPHRGGKAEVAHWISLRLKKVKLAKSCSTDDQSTESTTFFWSQECRTSFPPTGR